MTIIRARISPEEETLVMQYVKAHNISVSVLIREAVMEKIENEIDVNLYEKAMAEHTSHPQTVGFDEMVRLLND
jgi:hypothetical protein